MPPRSTNFRADDVVQEMAFWKTEAGYYYYFLLYFMRESHISFSSIVL